MSAPINSGLKNEEPKSSNLQGSPLVFETAKTVKEFYQSMSIPNHTRESRLISSGNAELKAKTKRG